MRISKKMAAIVAGISAFSFIGLANPVSAYSARILPGNIPSIHTDQKQKKESSNITLDQKANTAVDVITELDCTTHMVSAKVTNKTDGDITPTVTFNDASTVFPSTTPIEPGKSQTFFYNFSGNHMLVDIAVAVDTYETLRVTPTIHCSEPVTFTSDAVSESAVTGYLHNNSSLVHQTVLLRVGNGDIRTEALAPDETRLIALPFTAANGQTTAHVTVATTAGHESTYSVDFKDQVAITPRHK